VNTVPIGYEDGEVLQMKYSRVVKDKEGLVYKAFLVMMVVFAVVCGITLPRSLDMPASSISNLFGDRSLKGLFGLCGKKKPTPPPPPPPPPPPVDETTVVAWNTLGPVTLAAGQTKKFQTVIVSSIPALPGPAITFVNTAGPFAVFGSLTETQPNTGLGDASTECSRSSTLGATALECFISDSQVAGVTAYVWLENKGSASVTVQFRIYG